MEYFFENGYGNNGRIQIVNSECDICKKETLCISLDNSEDEYYDGRICKSCIDKLFLDVNCKEVPILSPKEQLHELPESILSEEEKEKQRILAKTSYEYCKNLT